MKAKFVKESVNELYVHPESMEVADPNETVDDGAMQDEFEAAIRNELTVPEYSRQGVSFRLKGTKDVIEALPMAQLKNGAYLMKVGDKFKKFNINDIIEE